MNEAKTVLLRLLMAQYYKITCFFFEFNHINATEHLKQSIDVALSLIFTLVSYRQRAECAVMAHYCNSIFNKASIVLGL